MVRAGRFVPMERLNALVDEFSKARVVVVGDLVIDEYIFGTTERISREAPVPVVREEKREIRLGGAGNVVANIRALGGKPRPVGIVGVDEMGRQLLDDLMASSGISIDGIAVDPSRFSTTKTRILAGGQNAVRQQMLRIDRVTGERVGPTVRRTLVDYIRRALEGADALVVSDYGEGVVEGEVFDEVLRIMKEGTIPVFVDSRYRIEHFRHADTLVPNEPELWGASKQDVSSEEGLEQAGRWLLQKTASRATAVKRGKRGMALFVEGEPTFKLKAYGLEEVADRTGAGDTVLAAYSLARSVGGDFRDAMTVANTCGGIKVTKSGTAVVTARELRQALEKMEQAK